MFGRHIHLELRRIAHELNSLFEVHTTLETASYLIYLTTFFYHFYCTIMQGSLKTISLLGWFIYLSWASLLIMRMYIINYICDNVGYKVNLCVSFSKTISI